METNLNFASFSNMSKIQTKYYTQGSNFRLFALEI